MKRVVLLLCFAITSCTAYKQISKEQITVKSGCEVLDLSRGHALMNVSLEGTQHAFMFDTGATVSTLNDSTIVADFSNRKFGTLPIPMSGADSKKIKRRIFTTQFENELFHSENKTLSAISMPRTKCQGKPLKGIIGLDCFFNDDKPLFLNFTDGKVCNITKSEMQARLAKGYHKIKSSCNRNAIHVYLTIAGQERKMLLDTGHSGQLIIPASSGVNLEPHQPYRVLEGMVYQTVASTTDGTESYYDRVPVQFAGEEVLTQPLVSGTLTSELIGLQFIKGFDWLIDYDRNEVYVKRNHLKIEETSVRKPYYAKADEKLIVYIKEKNQTKYRLGDEIVSVNGKTVTPENSCEMQSLLNKTQDWDTLDLEVIPASK